MKYKNYVIECFKFYIVFAVVCIVYWLYRNGEAIGKDIDIKAFQMLVGLNNGYSYQWILATVILLGYIFIVNKGMNYVSVSYLIRKSRDNIVKENIVRVIVNAVCYVAIYTSVDVIFLFMIADIKVLTQSNFFMAMLLFSMSLMTVYIVMGVMYTLIYLIVNNSYLSLIILFIINIIIVFVECYLHINIFKLYTNIGVVDEVVSGVGTNIYEWLITTTIQILVASVLYILVKEKYNRKDIICRDDKK